MIEKGVVADSNDGKIIVNIKRHPACGGCKACNMQESREMILELENTIGAQKGQSVNIELDDLVILKGACMFYGVPLLGLVLGIFAGKMIADTVMTTYSTEIISALSGIFFLSAALIAVRRYNLNNREKYKPRLIKS
jgi:sigma-E factor negative regulatory protein RseC